MMEYDAFKRIEIATFKKLNGLKFCHIYDLRLLFDINMKK